MSQWKIDAAKILSSQIAIKGYFAGEVAGIRLANREGLDLLQSKLLIIHLHTGADKLANLPPQDAPSTEINALKTKLHNTLEEIKGKNSKLTINDLRRLLFRCAATLIALERVYFFKGSTFLRLC